MFTIRGFAPQEEVGYSVTETPLLLSGSTLTAQSYKDFIADKVTATSSDNNCSLGITAGTLNTSVTATSLTPAICTVDASGKVARVADGVCTIEISAPGSKINFTRSMLRSAGGISYNQTGFGAGSLAKQVSDNIAAMVSGKTAGAATQMLFSGESYSTSVPVGTRNTGIFTAIDLSASSFTNKYGSQYPVHLISPRHFIGANHIPQSIGDTIVWLGNDNVFRSATVLAVSPVAGVQDISVGYLSAAITGITPYYFLPSNWNTYLASIGSTLSGQLSVPVLTQLFDDATSRRKLHIVESPRRIIGSEDWAQVDGVNPKSFSAWNSLIQGGDSSSPVIMPINDGTLKPVLITSYYSSNGGANYAQSITAINALMTSQAGGAAAVSTVSLAGFTTYP